MQSLLVLGGSGLVGSRLLELWHDRFVVSAPRHEQLDVLDAAALRAFLEQTRPDVVVNLAAWADVDAAEAQHGDLQGSVYQLNAAHPRRLALLCQDLRTHLLHVSTDYVFDGTNDQRPYREDDAANPLCWYAQTKLTGEELIRGTAAEACIARIEMPFTSRPHRKGDFARMCLARLRGGESIAAVTDQRITPVFLDDALEALRRLVELRVTGTVHVASASWTTPYEFARAIAMRLGLERKLIRATDFEEFATKRAARRPRHSWLDVSKATGLIGNGVLRSVEQQIDVWASQMAHTSLSSELVR